DYSELELSKIPKEGPFVIVSNFPLGGIEALVLSKVISKVRDDFKIVSNARFHDIEPFESLTLPINKVKKKKNKKKKNKKSHCLECTKAILQHVENGGALGFFLARGPSLYNRNTNLIIDNQWDTNLAKLVKIVKAPIVPVFFNDSFRKSYHILGNFHPLLQSFFVQKEMMKKKDSSIGLRFGSSIKISEQDNFSDIWRYTRFLRARCYALGASSPIDIDKFFKYKKKFKINKAEAIADQVAVEILEKEIDFAKKDYLLRSQNEFDIVCAPANVFPNVLTEIGRLREITFRDVGEGSNKSLDIDEYDLYYQHLIIWDREAKKIAGAYRIGLGDEIISRFSAKGFYLNSLFKMKKDFIPFLQESLEMGRSFIIKEYQRKPLSLFLLWKGILYFLLKNSQYRYLIGPASISQDFSELSKNLIVSFFETFHLDKLLSSFVKPRKKYKINVENFDKNILLQDIGDDLNKLDKYIKEIEPGSRMPVLFKKYIGMGAKILAFNVDPKFNNCLDGMIFLNVFDVPQNMLKNLAKDLEDKDVLSRFNLIDF
ncbi:MAG: lysophospholipid acyltransferase family protein, partial [Bacteroidota bacterium]|nr:lysophospholipid acyltransferase family protein [Bacteroidota bacterium]